MFPWATSLLDLFFPRYCHDCGRLLLREEHTLCLECIARLPRTTYHGDDNQTDQRMFGRFPYVHGASLCFYRKDNVVARLLQAAKYNGRPWINYDLGRLFAYELQAEGWPFDIDLILPVPIHWRRQLVRGYNQVHPFGRALSEVWGIPMDTHSLKKIRYTESQVKRTFEERLQHVSESFAVRRPEALASAHVLLIDDVLTSGATLSACADALQAIPGIRISFLTLAMAN